MKNNYSGFWSLMLYVIFFMNQQSEVMIADPPVPEPPSCIVHSFFKKLTASDTSQYTGIILLPKHADNCLPPPVRFCFTCCWCLLSLLCH